MRDKPADVAAYFGRFDEPVRRRMEGIRSLVLELLPEAEETIKYGIPTFVYNGNLVHYAGYKGHIGLYPTPSGMSRFDDELRRYERGKGSVRFPLDEELPIDLIRRIIAFRIEEQGGRNGEER
ncbi:MAG TPA: DUF1801 domain-containing protein [Spirochaetia bacterium]|nr:DUF1801 domain-containing protein [Spirochaetaceae bacterium]HPE90046.1 DUF1801 domain-containing protein [Spirochaetales bacterium]HRW24936.1 DUF1801 domain-containing protein [Spirochaetia bacterium]